jgi:hypothetical protein
VDRQGEASEQLCTSIHIYIHKYHIYIHLSLSPYMYIVMYVERERDSERARERERTGAIFISIESMILTHMYDRAKLSSLWRADLHVSRILNLVTHLFCVVAIITMAFMHSRTP